MDSSDPEKRIKTKPGFHFAILGNGYETHVLVGVLSVSVLSRPGFSQQTQSSDDGVSMKLPKQVMGLPDNDRVGSNGDMKCSEV